MQLLAGPQDSQEASSATKKYAVDIQDAQGRSSGETYHATEASAMEEA